MSTTIATSPVETTGLLDVLREDRDRIRGVTDAAESIWRDEPVRLDEFMASSDYCNLPHPLTPLQREAAISVLGENPKAVFDREEGTDYDLAVLLWGKGSGKDYTTSIIQIYCIYLILCLKQPQEYFDQAPGEPLDVVNVAYSAEQAKQVYFIKFLERLKRCKWFRDHFDLFRSGKRVGPKIRDSWGDVQIGATTVTFPGNIRAISESSANEGFEGYNIIVWIMDEASAFRSAKKIENAKAIYNTLRTSANTRFIRRWKGFVLSYPRAEDDWDFTTKLYKESLTNPRMFGSRHFSWEVAPATAYPGGRFEFTYTRENETITIEVPEFLRHEFETDPEEALGMYCCMPGRSQGAFFEMAGAVPNIFVNKDPVFVTEDIIVETWAQDGTLSFRGVGHNIVDWNVKDFDPDIQYLVHVDAGLSQDSAALALGHGEPILVDYTDERGIISKIWSYKVVEDAHIVWVPDPKRNLRVSLKNIETVIVQMATRIPITLVTYDHWNSATSIETLASKGIPAYAHNISREDYNLFKSIIYAGDIELIASELTERELIQLRRMDGGKVDHPEGGSKDLADALVGITRAILKDKKVMKHVKAKNVGMPVATTTAVGAQTQNWGVGDAGSGHIVSPVVTTRTERMMADTPPMPFGIGSSSQLRPSSRGVPSGRGNTSMGDRLLNARIKELARA